MFDPPMDNFPPDALVDEVNELRESVARLTRERGEAYENGVKFGVANVAHELGKELAAMRPVVEAACAAHGHLKQFPLGHPFRELYDKLSAYRASQPQGGSE